MAQQKVEEVKDSQEKPRKELENIYFLMITVKSAKDLERADFTGSSDPFCKVIANKQTWRTKTIMKNLNPEWNESTSFVFFDPVDKITFEVYDWDKGSKSDLIGTCDLEVKSFYDDKSEGFKGSINLTKCKHGSVNVEVNGRLVKPLELEERCNRLEQQVAKQNDDVSSKNQQVEELMAQNKASKDEKHRLLKEQEALNGQIANLRQQIDAQKQKNSKKEEDIEQLKKEKEDLEGNIKRKESTLTAKRDEIKAEEAKLEAAKKEHKALQEAAEKRRTELNQDYN